MAKYDVKYPDAKDGVKDWADETRGVFKSKDMQDCGHCKEGTHFIDIGFHCAICSDECNDAYAKSVNATIERMHEAKNLLRYSDEQHEFEPDDHWCITASCYWCGKEIAGNSVPLSDPVFKETCSARIPQGTDNASRP